MPYIRKAAAGGDSFGHSWPHDGAVVEVPHEEAEELLAIPDGGFELVLEPAAEDDDAGEDDGEPDTAGPEPDVEVSEPAPESEEPVAEVTPEPEAEAKPAPRKRAARKPAEG